jgi:hypothetical protein
MNVTMGDRKRVTSKPTPTSAQALFTEQVKPKAQKSITCTYCRGDHQSVKCHVVTDVKARKSILVKKG